MQYFFLIVGEVLNHMVKAILVNNKVKRIGMLCSNLQQIIPWYVDDTSLIIEGDEKVVRNLGRLLHIF